MIKIEENLFVSCIMIKRLHVGSIVDYGAKPVLLVSEVNTGLSQGMGSVLQILAKF